MLLSIKNSITPVKQPIFLISVRCIRAINESIQNLLFALLAIEVNFACCPLLQLLLSPNDHFNDCIFKCVVSLAYKPVLVTAIVISFSIMVNKIRCLTSEIVKFIYLLT